MKNIKQRFFEELAIKWTGGGFRRYRQSYFRVVGDVVQTIAIRTYSSGKEIQVLFNVIPLCSGIEGPDIGTGFDLAFFDPMTHALHNSQRVYATDLFLQISDERRYMKGWIFDNHSEASIDMLLERVFRFVEQYVTPFFEKAVSCVAAQTEVISLGERWYEIQKQLEGKTPPKGSEYNPIEFCSTIPCYLMEMTLKAGNYSMAKAFLLQRIDFEKKLVALNNSRLEKQEKELKVLRSAPVDLGREAVVEWVINQLEYAGKEKETLLNWMKVFSVEDIISSHLSELEYGKVVDSKYKERIRRLEMLVGYIDQQDSEAINRILYEKETYTLSCFTEKGILKRPKVR